MVRFTLCSLKQKSDGFFSDNDIQCHINEKSNIEVLETADVGFRVPEWNASTVQYMWQLHWVTAETRLGQLAIYEMMSDGVDGSISIKLKLWILISLCSVLQMRRELNSYDQYVIEWHCG